MKDRALNRVGGLGVSSVTLPYCVVGSSLTLSLVCKDDKPIPRVGDGWRIELISAMKERVCWFYTVQGTCTAFAREF